MTSTVATTIDAPTRLMICDENTSTLPEIDAQKGHLTAVSGVLPNPAQASARLRGCLRPLCGIRRWAGYETVRAIAKVGAPAW
jgi:hypothetical protein